MSLGLFPRSTIKYTSAQHSGQIYIPFVNYALMVGCVAVVAGFQNSTRLGHAYGLIIASVYVITGATLICSYESCFVAGV